MGSLIRASDGTREPLRLQHTVGRAASCTLRLTRSEASGLHAAIRWSARGWEVRDLGSTNGTLVDGARIAPGGWTVLCVGSELSFGHADERWVLADDLAPAPRATPSDGGPAVETSGGVLALPPEEPLVLVARAEDGSWTVEDAEGNVSPAGESVVVGERTWTLELPTADPRTPLAAPGGARPVLRFTVSADEEHVSLLVRAGDTEHDLGARVHHYLLLTLARLRARDAVELPGAAAEHGWVGLPQLTRMLRLDERPLNLQIFRIRRQFAELGILPSPEVIERRRGTGQVRLGAVEVEFA